jgi:hypothetical protein
MDHDIGNIKNRTQQAELFRLTADIKRSKAMLKSEYAEIKQQYRAKIRILATIENQIYENFESNQMELFASGISISPEAQQLLETPSI